MPLFTVGGANWLAKKVPSIRFNADTDCFACELDGSEDPPETYNGIEILIAGKGLVKVYSVGSGSWCWDRFYSTESLQGMEVAPISI